MDELKTGFMQFLTESRKSMDDERICQLLRHHMRDPDTIARVNKQWQTKRQRILRSKWFWICSISVLVLAVGASVVTLSMPQVWEEMQDAAKRTECLVDNNIFVMEMSRPIFDCNICRNITVVPVVTSISQSEFLEKYAYSSIPVLVKQATVNWTAMGTFSFKYFKKLYKDAEVKVKEKRDKARAEEQENNAELAKEHDLELPDEDEEIIEHEDEGLACQFFPYKTEFLSLVEALGMSDERATFKEGEKPWYFGWSNCNEEVQAELRRHYQRPYFLPEESETSSIDWMFMGGRGRGAPMHLDSVNRPSWQAQISGRKTWSLDPPPECLAECNSMNVTMESGDIFVVDTNTWYHGTFVHPGDVSICIGSEYD